MGRKNKDRKTRTANSRSRVRLYAVGAAAVVVVALVAVALVQNLSGSHRTSAAALPVVGIQGDVTSLDLASYSDQVVVVNYMAGWCQPCWAEIPGFVEVYRDLKDKGLAMVGISLQTSRQQTETMISQLGIPYPVFEDTTGAAAASRFQLRGMPTTFIFQNGELLYRLDGEVSGKTLRTYVEDLL